VVQIRDEITATSKWEDSPCLYDLRSTESSDDCYFTRVAGFSDRVLEQAENRIGAILDQYVAHSKRVLRETRATRGEAALDLLTVGAVTELYWDLARRVPDWVLRDLQNLAWKRVRPAITINMLRDALYRTFMKADCGRDVGAPRSRERENIDLKQLSHLVKWLQCTVDLREPSRCVINCSSFLQTLPPADASRSLQSIWEFFDWFEFAADAALGRYTSGISGFLAGRGNAENRRPDRFLRGKKPVTYHLAMVSAEIGNRVMRRSFRGSPRKVLLLPACMRGANARRCVGGQSSGLDVSCSGCDCGCGVNRATALMQKSGVNVYVENCVRTSPRWTGRWGTEPGNGIVIVACLANLRSLQLAARSAGMICQFLPLDYPGCQAHWRRARVPTTLNENELVRLVTVSAHANSRGRSPAFALDAIAVSRT
jgi:uncharacterized protein